MLCLLNCFNENFQKQFIVFQASQIPLMTVINLTLPEIKKFYEVLTWKEFSSSIMWGKIVYPL